MPPNDAQASARYFSPHASLAAIGLKLRSLKLLAPIEQKVKIQQKTLKHSPLDKLQDAFIAILAGAHGLVEINTRLRSDTALQRAFGRTTCAEQSLVQSTLNACTTENVTQMEEALTSIFRTHSHAYRHDYRERLQLLDVDITGMPCGPKAALSCKGYFASEGIRYGRQLGRVSATHYEEIVVDQLYPGNAKLTEALQPLVVAAEERLKLDYAARQRTVLRIDAGGGSLSDVNWCLARGYQLHCKDFSSKRAEAWAATVEEWFTDPAHPERQMGWVIPMDTPDYVLPVRRIAIRHRKRNGQIWYQLLISTLEPRQVMELLSRPVEKIYEPEPVALSYVQLYDKRGGAVEIEIKESKQGIGITRRRKKRAEAQQMVVLLNSLAHNVLVWARRWMSAPAPKLKRYGLLRLVRDVLSVSGFLQINEDGEITSIVLNRSSAVARNFITAFQATLTDEGVAVELSGT